MKSTLIYFVFIFLVSLYGTRIHSESSEKWLQEKSLSGLHRVMSIIFASFIFLIEEVQNIINHYEEGKIIQFLRKKHTRFDQLSPDGKNKVRIFFNAKIRRLVCAQKLICRESSIQVALQLTLILYQENFQGNLRLFCHLKGVKS